MPVQLPTFEGSDCILLSNCAEIHTRDKKIIGWLKKQKPIDFRYSVPGGSIFVQARFGGQSGHHFHVDALAEPAGKKKLSTPSRAVSSFQQAFSKLTGLEVSVAISAGFPVAQDKLPPIIKAVQLSTQKGNVAIRMKSGRFDIAGAAIHSISWMTREKDKETLIVLEASKKVRVGDAYLQEALDLAVSSFKVFVLGSETDVGESNQSDA